MTKDVGEHLKTLHMTDGVFASEYTIPAGIKLVQHRHVYSHLAILAKGKAVVRVNGQTRDIEGPLCFEIPAETHHGVLAITDCVWFCIHDTSHADANNEELIIEPDYAEMARIKGEL